MDNVVVPEMRDALRFLNRAYKEEGCDPEFAIFVPFSKYQERFVQGKVSSLSAHAEANFCYGKIVTATVEAIPGAEVIAVPHPHRTQRGVLRDDAR